MLSGNSVQNRLADRNCKLCIVVAYINNIHLFVIQSPSTSVDAEVTAATADPDEGTSASGPPAMDIEESWLVIGEYRE